MEMLTAPKPSLEEVEGVVDHLWAFSQLGKLRKTVLLAVSQSMTAVEISRLSAVFEELDLTNDGTIGFAELTHVIQKYAHDRRQDAAQQILPDEINLRKLFEALDLDNSGLIKYSEFIAACLEQNVAYSDCVIADAFSKMDLDKSGFITKENLTDLMRSASNDLNDDQVRGRNIENTCFCWLHMKCFYREGIRLINLISTCSTTCSAFFFFFSFFLFFFFISLPFFSLYKNHKTTTAGRNSRKNVIRG